jgi:hypothetical protein
LSHNHSQKILWDLSISSYVFFGCCNSNFFFYRMKSLASCPTPKPGGLDLHIYVPQWQSGPIILPGIVFPFHHVLRLAGLRWRYLNLPPHSRHIYYG